MRKTISLLSLLSLIGFSGCAPIIKPHDLSDLGADKEIALSQVVQDPEAYKGRMVLWGGEILRSANKKEGTVFEVLQLPLDKSDRPKDVDASEGRFLVVNPAYLDVAIYRPKREVTVVGEIQDVKTLPLGEIEYAYPYLRAKKIHLWEARPETIKVYHEYSSVPWRYTYWSGYPFWWGHPYWW